MAEIKVIEKNTAPNTNWTQIIVGQDESLSPCAYKVTFDRTYPYIWVRSDSADYGKFGLALTKADVERAVVPDEETGEFKGFDVYSDGVMPLAGSMAFCIAMGPRSTFYLLSNAVSSNAGDIVFSVSAQDSPVCPFVCADPW
ncbi:MAG: hypothetical protein NC078_01690 [Ruminococcus sp.]|nr:hypothetical protein [Ruminococcus sp.]